MLSCSNPAYFSCTFCDLWKKDELPAQCLVERRIYLRLILHGLRWKIEEKKRDSGNFFFLIFISSAVGVTVLFILHAESIVPMSARFFLFSFILFKT